jgi:hypothetical protein
LIIRTYVLKHVMPIEGVYGIEDESESMIS